MEPLASSISIAIHKNQTQREALCYNTDMKGLYLKKLIKYSFYTFLLMVTAFISAVFGKRTTDHEYNSVISLIPEPVYADVASTGGSGGAGSAGGSCAGGGSASAGSDCDSGSDSGDCCE